MRRCKHNWEMVKKGRYNSFGNFFADVFFACHQCGATKRVNYTHNYVKAGYSREKYEALFTPKTNKTKL